jgi:hypothetical protein
MARSVAEFRAAWARRLPQLPCPVKFEQDRVWCRSTESKRSKEIWEQYDIPQTAPEIWPIIEAEALRKESAFKANGTNFEAVVFREDEDGNYFTEPVKWLRRWISASERSHPAADASNRANGAVVALELR